MILVLSDWRSFRLSDPGNGIQKFLVLTDGGHAASDAPKRDFLDALCRPR
jgi:hypothetical protein